MASTSMKFGLHVAPFAEHADARVLASLAHEAEAAGWDGFFIYDHIAREWPVPIVDPWIALAAIALETDRLRIGPMVTPLARRRPWKVARESASLDQLSGGRLVMGVGLGHRNEEFDAFGEATAPRVRAELLDEALEVMTGLWSGLPYSFNGRHFSVHDATFLPRPVQEPRIPIWVAGRWPGRAPFRRAARWDGVFPLPPSNAGRDLAPQEVTEILRTVRQQRTETGPFDVVQLGGTSPGAQPDLDLVERYGDAGVTWWLEDIHPRRFSGDIRSRWPTDAMRRRILAGPPRR